MAEVVVDDVASAGCGVGHFRYRRLLARGHRDHAGYSSEELECSMHGGASCHHTRMLFRLGVGEMGKNRQSSGCPLNQYLRPQRASLGNIGRIWAGPAGLQSMSELIHSGHDIHTISPVPRRGKGQPLPRTPILGSSRLPPLRSGWFVLTKSNTSRKIRKPPLVRRWCFQLRPGTVFGFLPEWLFSSGRVPIEAPRLALAHVTAMSRHANTGQNTMTLRKSGVPRINRITAGITSYTTVKRLRFPLALPFFQVVTASLASFPLVQARYARNTSVLLTRCSRECALENGLSRGDRPM